MIAIRYGYLLMQAKNDGALTEVEGQQMGYYKIHSLRS